MKQLVDFYKKYKPIIGLGVLTAMIMISFVVKNFWCATIAVIILYFLTCNFSEQICAVMYLAMFSGVSQIYISAIIFCFICTAVRYVVDVKKSRKPFYAKPFVFTTIFLLIFTFIHGEVDIDGFYNWALIVGLFYFIYFLYIYYKEIDVRKCFQYLFAAIVVSCILAGALAGTELVNWVYYVDSINVGRLRLFTLNINHLSMSCLFIIAYIIYDIMNRVMKGYSDLKFMLTKDFWIDAVALIVCFIVGILTMSKAFLVMIILFIFYFLVYLVFKLKAKSLYIIIPFFIIAGILGLIFKDFAYKLISRFFLYGLESKISKIFTGRTDIWEIYRDIIRGSIINMLFGVGLLTKDIIDIGPHNILIFFIYRVGFVGFVMMCVLAYIYSRYARNRIKITYTNCLPFMTFLILALEEMIFSDRFFMFLVFGIILMLQPKEKIPQNEETQELEHDKDVQDVSDKENLQNNTNNLTEKAKID